MKHFRPWDRWTSKCHSVVSLCRKALGNTITGPFASVEGFSSSDEIRTKQCYYFFLGALPVVEVCEVESMNDHRNIHLVLQYPTPMI